MLVTRAQARRLGVTDAQLRRATRRGVLLRRGQGVYALPEHLRSRGDVRADAAALKAVASHETAALWWGLELAHEPDGSHFTVSRNRGRRRDSVPGAVIHRRDLSDSDVVRRNGLLVTTVLQTVLDLARTLPLGPAVAAADSALRVGWLRPEELVAAVRSLPPGPGRRRAHAVAQLTDLRAGSVLESMTRVLLHSAGLAPTHTQYCFVDRRGCWIGNVDFAWTFIRLLLEADGFAFHRDRSDYRSDRRRANAFAREGWWLLRVTWEDVVHEPDVVVALVAETIQRLGEAA